MKKDLAIIFGLFLLIIFLVIFGGGFTSTTFLGNPKNGQVTTNSTNTSAATEGASQIQIQIKSLTINAIVADDAGERKKGLSSRETLPLGEGMLFVFEKEDLWGIWMKDMEFAIDILWIDEDLRVIDIATNVAPEPGAGDRELTIYKPTSGALYILEINAGLADLNELSIGDSVIFQP